MNSYNNGYNRKAQKSVYGILKIEENKTKIKGTRKNR